MITHTSDSQQILSQNKTKSKLQILQNKYEMDPTRTVCAAERTRDAGRADGWADGQTDGRSETNIPPTTSSCGGIITSWDVT